eukprot:NODE_2743_length_1104_cov_65.467758_g2618_i0.p1 GENE.NODE_2743_length_1104_cov_65.467758_g2618_i0~~NODE_2743_length_1104_cov_65.467758_g2618_i0.p1  ORF type:complete len:339 (-),score=82.50 NODE_2743_length_1104_cov_65.467758_g2618_i0:87-1028(-)
MSSLNLDQHWVDEFGFVSATLHVKPTPSSSEHRKKWFPLLTNLHDETNQTNLSEAIQKGVPPEIRGTLWFFLLGLPTAIEKGRFEMCVSQPLDLETLDSIQRDLGRTFPTHCQFRHENSSGQRHLQRVLHAYATFNPHVGYVQGMGFLTATLLIHMTEEEAFWSLVQLMDKFKMEHLFLPGFPGLQNMFYILEAFLWEACPEVVQHMQQEGVLISFFASEWFLTIFVTSFPPSMLFPVWDMFLMKGWVFVFQIAVALIKWERARLSTLPMETLLPAMKLLHEGKTTKELIQRALKIPISEERIAELSDALTIL